MTTTPFCRVALLERPNDVPTLELLERLPKEALVRAEGFSSRKRRCDFLWNRWLLGERLHALDPNARWIERPPYAPSVLAHAPLYCSISHTGNLVAVALASHPVAIDVERPKPGRSIEAIWMRVMNRALWENTPPAARHDAFYAYWGLYECAVKLDGVFRHDEKEAYVERQGRRLPHRHRRLDADTVLTVVTDAIEGLTIETVGAPTES